MNALLRGQLETIQLWIREPSWQRILGCVLLIIIGCGLYGFTLGLWRSPVMGLYVGIKLPLLIFFTLICNGLLNGLLGILLGSRLGMRQSILALLMSFSILSLILGSLSPVCVFFLYNLPSPNSEFSQIAHSSYLLFHTSLIAYTGVSATVSLYRFLRSYCPNQHIARLTLISWVAGNGFLGAQFSWILRPFFGSPDLAVAFLREDPLNGTFYGAVVRSGSSILSTLQPHEQAILGVALGSIFLIILTKITYERTHPTQNNSTI